MIFDDSRKIIEVRTGEKFGIKLLSNPTTGYSWRLRHTMEKGFCELLGKEFHPSENRPVGSGGEEIWFFRVTRAVKTTISLEYARPWKRGTSPLREEEFIVRARN